MTTEKKRTGFSYMPWWEEQQKEYYENLPWGQRPFTAGGLIPPVAPQSSYPIGAQPTAYAQSVMEREGGMRPGGGAVRTPAQREEETFGFGMPPKTFAQPTAPVRTTPTAPTGGGYSQFPTQEPPDGYRWKFSAGAGVAGE